MKKENIWLPISILLGVVLLAIIGAYGYLFLKGYNFYESRISDTENVSSNTIEIKADDIHEYLEVQLEDFSTSVKPVVSTLNSDRSEEDIEDEDYGVNDGDHGERGDDSDGEYILPESDKRRLSESDLEDLTAKELTYARNEIYARHGRKFQSRELQEYFDSKDWYEMDEDFDDHDLKGVERENAEFIAEYQKDEGKTYKVN